MVLVQHLSAATFENRLRFQTDKGQLFTHIAIFAIRMFRMYMHSEKIAVVSVALRVSKKFHNLAVDTN